MSLQKELPSYDDIVATLPSLEPSQQVDLLRILSTVLSKSLLQDKKSRRLVDLEGLGAETWSGIDAQEYVHRERDAWS